MGSLNYHLLQVTSGEHQLEMRMYIETAHVIQRGVLGGTDYLKLEMVSNHF